MVRIGPTAAPARLFSSRRALRRSPRGSPRGHHIGNMEGTVIDFLIELGQHGTLQQRVYEGIYAALRDGRLQPGQRLPASRIWAIELGVPRNTIREATSALVAEGWLEARTGTGLFVRDVPRPSVRDGEPGADTPHDVSATAAPARPTPALSAWAARLPAAEGLLPVHALSIDFRLGAVSSGAERLFRYRRPGALDGDARAAPLAAYGDAAGEARLRERLAVYLRQSRAVRCTADDIVITSGSHQSLDLLCRLLLDPDRTLAVEDPGYPVAVHLARLAGADALPVPVDDDGLVVDAIPDGVAGVVCTPNHQFPLGVAMSPARRERLLARAARAPFFVIEDDYDCEYYQGTAPAPSLQSFDSHERVIYVGSLSKILAPGLRLGYIVAPRWLRDPLRHARWIADRQSSTYLQNALLTVMASGDFATHLHRMRAEYGRRRAVLLRELERTLGAWLSPLASRCGMHVAARVRGPQGAAPLCRIARDAGIGVYEGQRFSMTGAASDIMVFGFGNVTEAQIVEGTARLAHAWRQSA
ncbi:PLP-dependent aminotransferase family protein [Burkholderia sp. Ax-1724]|nr:PLP-dependent aminotransferase family protein [Burkholderia sp. Ax-1724]